MENVFSIGFQFIFENQNSIVYWILEMKIMFL